MEAAFVSAWRRSRVKEDSNAVLEANPLPNTTVNKQRHEDERGTVIKLSGVSVISDR